MTLSLEQEVLQQQQMMPARILHATKEVLLTAAEPDTKEPRQSLLSAAGRVGDASRALLNSIGDEDESQDMLLSLPKSVANASAALVVNARKCAETVDDSQQREEVISAATQTALSTSELVASAKIVAPTIMITNVTSLLKTVKAVEDEHTRGTRALEATIEAISQEIRAFDSSDVAKGRTIVPEDLVRATKPLTMAVAKAVAAGNSCRQDDIIVAANMGRKAISDLLTTCKAGAYGVDRTNKPITTIGKGCS